MQKPFSQPVKLTEQQARRKATISLTPLIDVVFILLVFFMLASSFLDWRSLPLDTSAAGRPAPSEQTPFVVRILEDGIELNGEAVTLEVLIDKAHAREPIDQPVSLQPQADTLVQRTVGVLDALNSVGVRPLKLVDDPEWQAEPSRDKSAQNGPSHNKRSKNRGSNH